MYGVTVVRASDDMIAVFNLMPGYWGGKVPATLGICNILTSRRY